MPRYPATLSGLSFNTDVNQNTRVELANIPALRNLTAFSVEAWVYLYSYPLSLASKVFGNYQVANTGFQLSLAPNGTFTGNTSNGTNTTSPTTTPAPLNRFFKIELSWDGTNVRIFLDGVLSGGTATLSGGNTGNPGALPNIGNAGGARAFPGVISELRISDIARNTANYTPDAAPFVTDANTVGLYHMYEGSGTIIADSSSQSNTGTLAGLPLPTWAPGRFASGVQSRASSNIRAIASDGNASLTSSAMVVNNGRPTPLTTLTDFTWSGWVKPSVIAKMALFSNCFNFGLNVGQEVLINDTSGALKVYQGNSATAQSSVLIRAGMWTHIAATQAGNSVTVYVNASVALTATLAQVGQSATENSYIGAEQGSGFKFNGQMAQVCNWSRALSQSEINRVYSGSIPATGLIQALLLNDGAGTIAYDSSGNGYNGTITSGTFASDVPTKKRQIVGGNLLYNADFEYAPPFTAPTTSQVRWIDGTAGGSTTNNLFKWALRSAATAVSGQFDSTNSYSGTNSLKISNTNVSGRASALITSTAYGALTEANRADLIPCLPSTSYTLTAWVKTNNVPTNGAYVQLVQINGSLGVGVTTNSAQLTGTNDWTQVSVTVTTGATARYLAPSLMNDVAGNVCDAWFDSVVLAPTVNTARAIAT